MPQQPAQQQQPSQPTPPAQPTSPVAAITTTADGGLIDLSKMTEEERNQLRQAMLMEINDAVKKYGRRSTLWSVFYYVVALLALAGNAIILITSSSLLSMAFTTIPEWIPVLNTVASVLAAGAVAVNAQLQSRMNAVYFNEAKEKYMDLKTLMWINLPQAVSKLNELDQLYDASGVGVLVSLDSLIGASSSNKKKKSADPYAMPTGEEIELAIKMANQPKVIEKKRYAYPTPRHLRQ